MNCICQPTLHPPKSEEGERVRTLCPRALSSGFTLLEVVVVLLIITIILGMVGINLTRNPADTLRDEAERLTLVLQNAQQQAILDGRPYGFVYTESGYLFARADSNTSTDGVVKLVPIEKDELLAPHELPGTIRLSPGLTAEESAKRANDKDRRFDQIVFDPSGDLEPFRLTLSIDDLYWYVRGQSDGQVVSSPLSETPAS